MKFENQDKIDNYVQGDMTAQERIAFEQDVQKDKELREQLEYTQKVKTLVTSHQEKMRLLKQWEEEYQQDEQVSAAQYRSTGTENYCPAPECHATAKTSSKKLYYWIFGIATVLVIGSFVVSPLFNFNSTESSGEIFRGDDEIFIRNDSLTTDSIIHDSIIVHEDEK